MLLDVKAGFYWESEELVYNFQLFLSGDAWREEGFRAVPAIMVDT